MDPKVEKKYNEFLSQFKTLKAKKGELICRPGENFQQLIFVRMGLLRQYVISKLGTELSINTVSPNYPFSFVHLLTGGKNKYFLEAVTPLEYVKVPKKEFCEYLDENHDVHTELTKQICFQLEEMMVNIEYFITGDAYMKVASIFYLMAKRFGTQVNGALEIEMMPTHKDISGLLGLTRETVSLQILKLEKDKVIQRKGRKVSIPNMKSLEEVSAYVAE
jgi:CRP-like cAMP-binding protein